MLAANGHDYTSDCINEPAVAEVISWNLSFMYTLENVVEKSGNNQKDNTGFWSIYLQISVRILH